MKNRKNKMVHIILTKNRANLSQSDKFGNKYIILPCIWYHTDPWTTKCYYMNQCYQCIECMKLINSPLKRLMDHIEHQIINLSCTWATLSFVEYIFNPEADFLNLKLWHWLLLDVIWILRASIYNIDHKCPKLVKKLWKSCIRKVRCKHQLS